MMNHETPHDVMRHCMTLHETARDMMLHERSYIRQHSRYSVNDVYHNYIRSNKAVC